MSNFVDNYYKDYLFSCERTQTFWSEQAEVILSWLKPWQTVLEGDFHHIDKLKWFSGGELNVCANCLDRHLSSRGDKVAIIWEGNDPHHLLTITYNTLYEQVCKFANVLKSFHIAKGDVVCIYMPMIPQVVIAMLACARIGAIHNVVFAGFSAHSLQERILNANCSVVITTDGGLRGSKHIPLKDNVDIALKECPKVRHVIVYRHTKAKINWHVDRDYCYDSLMKSANTYCEPVPMEANEPLFILYTSGSTGKPKGIIHATGGYLLHSALSFQKLFDYREDDIYWCTADVGWITGHSYIVYGPLASGATVLLFEGIPSFPIYARFWEIIDRHQVSIFYTSPTALRAIRKEGDELVMQTSRKSLRILGTVGEPINPDVWQWYFSVVGNERCPIIDTWWQTETGAAMIAPLPSIHHLKPGSAQWPFYGVLPEIVNDDGTSTPPKHLGKLVIRQPWPGMMKTIHNDFPRFQKYFKEFPGKYYSGDEAICDDQGYYYIKGRADDVINIAGHRLGTEEIESALLTYPLVSEVGVVPVQDNIKGEAVYAFVVLKSGHEPSNEIKEQLLQVVVTMISAIAKPKDIQFTNDLPKTRSGKIMRRILRKIANHDFEDLGDLSTLTNPEVINNLMAVLKRL
jgi:acetyl-CoA synthetase